MRSHQIFQGPLHFLNRIGRYFAVTNFLLHNIIVQNQHHLLRQDICKLRPSFPANYNCRVFLQQSILASTLEEYIQLQGVIFFQVHQGNL